MQAFHTTLKFAAAALLVGFSFGASAVPMTYSVTSRTDVYGADANHPGTTVSLQGYSGVLEIPRDAFSVAEIVVGLFSLTTTDPLSQKLPVGFNELPYAIDLRIGSVTKSLSSILYL